MQRVLRGCQATVAAIVFGSFGPANAADLTWQFSQDDESAFLGVTDSAAKPIDDQNYLFYMSCAGTGDETTVVSRVDRKALGEAIAKGEVPSISYLLDGQEQDNSGGQVADIRFDEMSGSWQYLIAGADYDLLLTAKTAKVKGAGVDLQLPEKDFAASLQKLKDACDKLLSSDEGDDSGDGGDGSNGGGGGDAGGGDGQ
jgi:hypothetical protein